VTASPAERAASGPFTADTLSGGLSASIVPDRAALTLRWRTGAPLWRPFIDKLRGKALPPDIRVDFRPEGERLHVTVHGRAAHGGANLAGGRNAIVALAGLMAGELPASGIADLLAFAQVAGQDLHGTGLGLVETHPLWGRYDVNVAVVRPEKDGSLTLVTNVRRTPPRTGAELKAHLEKVVADFNARTGAALRPGGYYRDEPLVFDPRAKIVRRLLAIYRRASGRHARPAISGGGTYAKRLPRSIAFGMWFPDKPYPGHDVDEKVPIADLHRGVLVLLEALLDIACSDPIVEPFKP
jgi:succinyl-diaminopimelate desuccinylase